MDEIRVKDRPRHDHFSEVGDPREACKLSYPLRAVLVLVSGLDKVQAVMRVLEAEGIEFLNHGEPGVKLRRKGEP